MLRCRKDGEAPRVTSGMMAGCLSYDVSLPRNLDETWRLSRVRVYKTTAGVSGQTPGAAAISGARG